MRIQVSADAAVFVGANGGELWVWAAHPRMCCSGSPAWMHAATAEPDSVHGFTTVEAEGLRLHFRPSAGQQPDVLEVAMTGGRHPKVAAYWDGCLMAMT